MRSFTLFLHKIFPGLESQEERDEDYLAQAIDVSDLERRIHTLEYRGESDKWFPVGAADAETHPRKHSS